jgi:hypothetical protein
VGISAVSISKSVVCFRDRIESAMFHLQWNSWQKLYKIWCSFVAIETIHHSFLQWDVETHTSYQSHNFHTTDVNALKSQLVQVETRTDFFFYYDHAAWLPLIYKIKHSENFIARPFLVVKVVTSPALDMKLTEWITNIHVHLLTHVTCPCYSHEKYWNEMKHVVWSVGVHFQFKKSEQ